MLAASHRQKLHLQIRWLLCLVQLLEVLQIPQALQHLLRARAEAKSLRGAAWLSGYFFGKGPVPFPFRKSTRNEGFSLVLERDLMAINLNDI